MRELPNLEIVLPQTKPETEWIAGRAVPKMSPTRDHSRLQTKLAAALDAWAAGRGEVGVEWRFRVAPPGETRRPLVPDVSYVDNLRLRELDDEQVQCPALSPDVAVEIASPGDRSSDVEEKIRVYLAAGSQAVVIVDPKRRTVVACDAHGRTTFREGDVFAHAALPNFSIELRTLFAALERPR